MRNCSVLLGCLIFRLITTEKMNKFQALLSAILCIASVGNAQIQNDELDSQEGSLISVEASRDGQLFAQTAPFCECEDFELGANENWPHILTACTANDGNMGEAQTFQIIVSSLPDEGATYRVAKTVANGNWDVSSETALELGTNIKTVSDVPFARSVKFQFSDCNIVYSVFSLNDEAVCGSTALVLGCTDDNACNYNPDATEDDQSCISIGDNCDDGDDLTVDDTIDENCDCAGQGDPAGLEDLDLEFNMGPNPAGQSVLVTASTKIEKVVVMNSVGATVLQLTPMSSSLDLNLQGVPDGVYVVKCYIGEEWVTRRIVVSQHG